MLSLVSQDHHDLPTALQSPGGFVWWYVDLIDAEGRGLVLIWSFGLPFLPDARRADLPLSRPSLSLALYEGGRACFYLLQTYAAEDAHAGPGVFRFGASEIELRFSEARTVLSARLDLSIPGGGRLRGRLDAQGARAHLMHNPPAWTPPGDHGWSPLLTAALGHARLQSDRGLDFDLSGRVYVDHNQSARPLHTLGIERWRWCRIAFPKHELIYYDLEPSTPGGDRLLLVLEVHPDGEVVQRVAEARLTKLRRSVYGLAYHEALELTGPRLDVRIQFSPCVDDGPFYLRFLARGEDAAAGQGAGVAEWVSPARTDRAWQRPFIRMRTHRTEGPNSMWLPLFCGPQRDRLQRLFAHWQRGSALREPAP